MTTSKPCFDDGPRSKKLAVLNLNTPIRLTIQLLLPRTPVWIAAVGQLHTAAAKRFTLSGNDDATQMISQICDVLRTSLASDTPSLISLSEEITVIEKYLAIEQIRIGPRLSTSLCVDADVLQAQVPVKILQPLIENAVKHGVSRVPGEAQITIRGYRDRDRLKVLVKNTGEAHGTSGLPETRVAGIGLTNTRQRLKTLYGSDFTLSLDWPQDGGCQVCLDLPFQIAEREDSVLCEC